jgi:hypothetical protein
MNIFCDLSMSEILCPNDGEFTTQIRMRFLSRLGRGRIEGDLLIIQNPAADLEFEITSSNDLGMPEEVCRQLLIAAYRGHRKLSFQFDADLYVVMPDFHQWLDRWLRALDAARLAWTVAHYLQQRKLGAAAPPVDSSSRPDILEAGWQVAIRDEGHRTLGGAKLTHVRLYSLRYAMEIRASVAQFGQDQSVVDGVDQDDCFLPPEMSRGLIQQLHRVLAPDLETHGSLVRWIDVDEFIRERFSESAETMLAMVHRPLRTFCQ